MQEIISFSQNMKQSSSPKNNARMWLEMGLDLSNLYFMVQSGNYQYTLQMLTECKEDLEALQQTHSTLYNDVSQWVNSLQMKGTMDENDKSQLMYKLSSSWSNEIKQLSLASMDAPETPPQQMSTAHMAPPPAPAAMPPSPPPAVVPPPPPTTPQMSPPMTAPPPAPAAVPPPPSPAAVPPPPPATVPPPPPSTSGVEGRLEQLKQRFDAGQMTPEEYEAEKSKILTQI